eukprot:scaffold1094_cov185-Alexandrium_tamarense.AAC.7
MSEDKGDDDVTRKKESTQTHLAGLHFRHGDRLVEYVEESLQLTSQLMRDKIYDKNEHIVKRQRDVAAACVAVCWKRRVRGLPRVEEEDVGMRAVW